jgi:hypothetical protein
LHAVDSPISLVTQHTPCHSLPFDDFIFVCRGVQASVCNRLAVAVWLFKFEHPDTCSRNPAGDVPAESMGNCCGSGDGNAGVVANTNIKVPKVTSVKFCVADKDGKMGQPVTTFHPSTRTFNLIGSISHKSVS